MSECRLQELIDQLEAMIAELKSLYPQECNEDICEETDECEPCGPPPDCDPVTIPPVGHHAVLITLMAPLGVTGKVCKKTATSVTLKQWVNPIVKFHNYVYPRTSIIAAYPYPKCP